MFSSKSIVKPTRTVVFQQISKNSMVLQRFHYKPLRNTCFFWAEARSIWKCKTMKEEATQKSEPSNLENKLLLIHGINTDKLYKRERPPIRRASFDLYAESIHNIGASSLPYKEPIQNDAIQMSETSSLESKLLFLHRTMPEILYNSVELPIRKARCPIYTESV